MAKNIYIQPLQFLLCTHVLVKTYLTLKIALLATQNTANLPKNKQTKMKSFWQKTNMS